MSNMNTHPIGFISWDAFRKYIRHACLPIVDILVINRGKKGQYRVYRIIVFLVKVMERLCLTIELLMFAPNLLQHLSNALLVGSYILQFFLHTD